jgi:hypothetical protein
MTVLGRFEDEHGQFPLLPPLVRWHSANACSAP